MTSIQKFPNSEFPTIYCTKLVVRSETTPLKWSTSNKSTSVAILGSIDTAKTFSPGATRGALGAYPFVIGTDAKSWFFDIYITGGIHAGMGDTNMGFESVEDAAIDKQLAVTEGDRVIFNLTASSTLSIKHTTGIGTTLSTSIYDLTDFNGQTLYYWVSSVPEFTMSVKVLEDLTFVTTVSETGEVKMVSDNKELIDFAPPPGGPPVSAGDSITNTTSGASVSATSDGDIIHAGGVSYKVENNTSAVVTITLAKDQHIVLVSNTTTTGILLPSAVDNPGKKYIIIRNYPVQGGEVWKSPVLIINTSGSDTIEGESSFGIPAGADIHLMSDGIDNWRIL